MPSAFNPVRRSTAVPKRNYDDNGMDRLPFGGKRIDHWPPSGVNNSAATSRFECGGFPVANFVRTCGEERVPIGMEGDPGNVRVERL